MGVATSGTSTVLRSSVRDEEARRASADRGGAALERLEHGDRDRQDDQNRDERAQREQAGRDVAAVSRHATHVHCLTATGGVAGVRCKEKRRWPPSQGATASRNSEFAYDSANV